MRHVISIQGYGTATKSGVHLAGVNNHTLCGQMKLTRVIEGETFPTVADTKRDVTCKTCHKALEMLVRRKLGSASTSTLERLLEEWL